MGISKLSEVLTASGNIGLVSNDKKGLGKLLGGDTISNSTIYVDFSILMYKFLMSSPSFEDAYRNISNFFNALNNHNNIIKIFLDPKKISKKKELQKKRNIGKTKETKKLKTCINNTIQENKDINPDILINEKVSSILQLDSDVIIPTNYSSYKEDLEDINTFSLISFKEPIITTTTAATVISSSEEEELETADPYELLETPSPSSIVLDLSPQADMFKLFVYSKPFNYHQKHILECLMNDNLITSECLYEANEVDAEFALIQEYKKDDSSNIKIICSTDQDLIFLSLFNCDEKYLCFSPLTSKVEELKIIRKTKVSQNLAFLTIFFNSSDYFSGIYNCALTKSKVIKLRNHFKNIEKIEDKKKLVKTFLEYCRPLKSNFDERMPVDYIENIDEYFEQLKLYSMVSNVFYKKEGIKKITISQLQNYFIKTTLN